MHHAFGLRVNRTMSTPSTCAPEATAIISLTNGHHTLLTEMQYAVLPQCLRTRMVVYCLLSVRRNVSFSELCHWAEQDMRASDFGRNDYMKFSWLKWRLIARASRFGQVFFVDADVLIVRNPFPLLVRVSAPVAFQREAYNSSSSSSELYLGLNSGQVWLRKHSLALELEMLTTRRGELEQRAVQRFLYANGSTPRYLLPHSFVGYCWDHGGDTKGLVTFHAHCLGTLHEKRLAMARIIAKIARTPECAIHPLQGGTFSRGCVVDDHGRKPVVVHSAVQRTGHRASVGSPVASRLPVLAGPTP
jgi:hypothetical protein